MDLPLLQSPEQRWLCARCTVTAVTRGQPNRFHECAGLGGISAPLVLEGSGGVIRAVLREDYVRGEQVTVDDAGRPVMAVVTERPDGSYDTVVNAPAARGGGGVHELDR